MDERIQAHYYADEDEAAASFEVSDIEDLMRLLEFYKGEPVTLGFIAKVKTAEFEASAVLSMKHDRNLGMVLHIESEALSPDAAAGKIIAAANALRQWNRKRPIGSHEEESE